MAFYRNSSGDDAFVIDGSFRFGRRNNDGTSIGSPDTYNGKHCIATGILSNPDSWYSYWTVNKTTSFFKFNCTKSRIRLKCYVLAAHETPSYIDSTDITFVGCTTEKVITQSTDPNLPYIEVILSDINSTITCNIPSMALSGVIMYAQAL